MSKSTSFVFSLLDSLLQEFIIILRFPSCFLMTSSFSSGQSRQHPVLPWWRSVSNTGSIYLCTCAIVRESLCLYVRFVGLMESGVFIIITGWCCQQKKHPCSQHTQTCVSDTHRAWNVFLFKQQACDTTALYSVTASSFMFLTRSTLMSKCFCIGGGGNSECDRREEGEKEE